MIPICSTPLVPIRTFHLMIKLLHKSLLHFLVLGFQLLSKVSRFSPIIWLINSNTKPPVPMRWPIIPSRDVVDFILSSWISLFPSTWSVPLGGWTSFNKLKVEVRSCTCSATFIRVCSIVSIRFSRFVSLAELLLSLPAIRDLDQVMIGLLKRSVCLGAMFPRS